MAAAAETVQLRGPLPFRPKEHNSRHLLLGLAAQHARDPTGVQQELEGLVAELKKRGNETFQGVIKPLLASGDVAALVDCVTSAYTEQCRFVHTALCMLAGLDPVDVTTSSSRHPEKCDVTTKVSGTTGGQQVGGALHLGHGPIPSFTAQHPHQTRPLIAYTASPIMPLQSTFMGAMKAQRNGQILALTDPRHLVLVALMHWPPSASGDLVDCPSTHNLDEISSWALHNKALILDGCVDPVPPEVVNADGRRLRLLFRPEHYEASAEQLVGSATMMHIWGVGPGMAAGPRGDCGKWWGLQGGVGLGLSGAV